jgi:hypothetical protein
MKTNATLTSIKQNDALENSGEKVTQNAIVLAIMLESPERAWTIPAMSLELAKRKHYWGMQNSTVSRVFNSLSKNGDIEQSDFDTIKSLMTGARGMARRLAAKHRQMELI